MLSMKSAVHCPFSWLDTIPNMAGLSFGYPTVPQTHPLYDFLCGFEWQEASLAVVIQDWSLVPFLESNPSREDLRLPLLPVVFTDALSCLWRVLGRCPAVLSECQNSKARGGQERPAVNTVSGRELASPPALSAVQPRTFCSLTEQVPRLQDTASFRTAGFGE